MWLAFFPMADTISSRYTQLIPYNVVLNFFFIFLSLLYVLAGYARSHKTRVRFCCCAGGPFQVYHGHTLIIIDIFFSSERYQ